MKIGMGQIDFRWGSKISYSNIQIKLIYFQITPQSYSASASLSRAQWITEYQFPTGTKGHQ